CSWPADGTDTGIYSGPRDAPAQATLLGRPRTLAANGGETGGTGQAAATGTRRDTTIAVGGQRRAQPCRNTAFAPGSGRAGHFSALHAHDTAHEAGGSFARYWQACHLRNRRRRFDSFLWASTGWHTSRSTGDETAERQHAGSPPRAAGGGSSYAPRSTGPCCYSDASRHPPLLC